jgi:signal transduction histidine kinase
MSFFKPSPPSVPPHTSTVTQLAVTSSQPTLNLVLPVWQVDVAGKLVWCNDAYGALFDCTPDDAVARQKLVSATGNPRQHLIVKGQRRLFNVSMTDQQDGSRLGVLIDVTREEDLESEHKRNQTATKELLEQLGTAVATFTADQRLEFFNSAFTRLWQLEDTWLATRPKLGEILEKLREARRLPEQADFKRYKQTWLDMFTNLIDPTEDMSHLPDGTTLRMLVVPNPAGGLMFTFEDVTSRLALETSYNTLVAVQRETLDNLTEGVAVFGGDGRLKLWNPSFAQLWGLNPEDMQAEPHITRLIERVAGRFAPAEWPAARDSLLSQVLNGAEISVRLRLADNHLVACNNVVLPDGGVLLSHVDVTDSVQVENALREKNAAFEAAERLKLDFLANVSYQLRTPLNAIMGFTEILDHQYFGTLNEKQLQYTQGTKEASERLLTLIDDILDLSTLEAGYLKLEYEQVDLAVQLRSLYGLTEEWARKEGLELALDVDGLDVIMDADPRRLKQIILSLLRNAIAFTPTGGQIRLSAKRNGDQVMIEVGDNGAGVPTEEQQRIFEPFERGANADRSDGRRGSSGAGLGLTLVRNIAELHGGTVGFDSVPGRGTVVTLTLPLKAPVI